MLEQEVQKARRARRRRADRASRVIAYMRVSTEEQAQSRAGLDVQRSALQAEIDRRGWADVEWIEDAGQSGKSLDRPGIRRALDTLSVGEAIVLLVAKLDRLSRSLLDFAALMETAQVEGWAVIALDLGVDTTTASGEMIAAVLAAFAQYERRLISERTSAALKAKSAAFKAKKSAVRIGRPPEIRPDVRARLHALRKSGLSYAAIAERMNVEAVPTARGRGRWYASTVHCALGTEATR